VQGVYTIPITAHFLDKLAQGILERTGGDGESLTRWRVLLPTRRAGRELRESFLRLTGNTPLLLPLIRSIGDVDAEELDLYLGGYGDTLLDIPPAIPALERLFLLAELTRRKDANLSIDQSLVLARGLATLIDQVHTEDLDFSHLSHIVPDNLSSHWQETLDFLEIVTAYWPSILAERGVIDPADRRNRLMKALSKFWQDYPPDYPILAAGSTGSIPTTARLLKTISSCPQGAIVLPGLDTDMPDAMWNEVTNTHPQATMKNLLRVFDITRGTVRPWVPDKSTPLQQARRDVLCAVMAPATHFARDTNFALEKGMAGVRVIEAADAPDEAMAIAIAIRDILQIEDKTACFVTPDRILARRVMTALGRWGVMVDDSAGGALAVTPLATLFSAILRAVKENLAPLPLLDLLKHSLVELAESDTIIAFEKDILRGPRPDTGIAGLKNRIAQNSAPHALAAYMELVNKISAALDDLLAQCNNERALEETIKDVVAAASALVGGDDVLWSQAESETFSGFISNVINHSQSLPPLSFAMFADVFHELISQENYRATDANQRRILFLGQLESRLIRRDVMILGGLNEGVWPTSPSYDPWMSRPMRRDFGLPTYDRIVGLSAHDVECHGGAAEVIITRSLKAEGTATVPARWLQRLKALYLAQKITPQWNRDPYIKWSRMIDKPAQKYIQSLPPAPTPPLAVRPEKLSATAIEKWINNPYRIYAERILKLRRLNPVDEDVTHAERGSLVHDVLHEFVKSYPHSLPPDATEIMLRMAREKLGAFQASSHQWHYWWPRLERLVAWFVHHEETWRREAMTWRLEYESALKIYESADGNRSFTVTAKADRIDRLKSGGAVIIDYKTGRPPAKRKVEGGKAPQLPIEAFLLAKGAYGDITDVSAIAFWHLTGANSKAGEIKPVNTDIPAMIAATEDGLLRLVKLFEDAQTPYLAQALTGQLYDDDKAYAHLARMAEWISEDVPESETDEGDAA
jgi:ATP-dependent helicase/nuclease subunit B